MTNRTTTLVLGALLSLSGVLHAQASQGGRVSDDQLQSISATIRLQIRAIADSAFAAGLPTEPILDKVRSARISRATDTRAVGAASALLRDMRVSRAALGATATPEDIKVGVEALRAGVSVATLTSVSNQKRSAALYVSLSVLSDLVTARVPVDTAVRAVTGLLAAGVRDADLSSYKKTVLDDIARGAIPSAAATTRAVLAGGITDINITGPGVRVPNRPPIPPEAN